MCLRCGAILESLHTNDFVQCTCENHTFTDGGTDYQRYGGVKIENIKIIKGEPKPYIRERGFGLFPYNHIRIKS